MLKDSGVTYTIPRILMANIPTNTMPNSEEKSNNLKMTDDSWRIRTRGHRISRTIAVVDDDDVIADATAGLNE